VLKSNTLRHFLCTVLLADQIPAVNDIIKETTESAMIYCAVSNAVLSFYTTHWCVCMCVCACVQLCMRVNYW